MQLLPGQVHVFVARQGIERSCFDRMNDFLRRSFCRNEIEPPPCRELRVIQSQNILGDGIASSEAIKQPSVEFVRLQRFLQRFDVCFHHWWPFLRFKELYELELAR